VVVVGCLAALVVTVGAALASGSANQAGWSLPGLLGLCWLEFALAYAALRRISGRAVVVLIVVGAVALQVVAVAFPPRMTDDYYRYAWDGRVQAAGIDPYRYAPVDPALSGLRDPWLFPPACRQADPPCTRMNHPTDPTIYPPVAQAEFLAVHDLTRPLGPAGGGDLTWQLLGAVLALATGLALLRILRARGDPRQAALWAWCPTVVLECGNNGHVDALAALLVVLALAAGAAGHPRRAGAALGAAIATKILPVLVLPALLAGSRTGRTPRLTRILGAAALVVVTGYLPHLFAVGTKVFGFLPGYLAEEGYQGHSRYGLLRVVLPDAAATVIAAITITGVAVMVARRTDPRRPWGGAVVLVGTAFMLGGITYPWYALLLVALVALDGRWEWLAVAAAAYPGYLTTALHLPWTLTQQVSYACALVLLVAGYRLRIRCGRYSRTQSPPLP
jgi:Glycosyltransferase family 87